MRAGERRALVSVRLVHAHAQYAVLQSRVEPFARSRVVDAAHDPTVFALQNGVTAGDGRERTHRFQGACEPLQAQRMPLQRARDRGLRTRAETLQTIA